MDLSQFSPAIELQPGQTLRLENAFGQRVTVLTGNVWVTQDRDPRDVVLSAGDDFLLDRPGLAILTSLDGAATVARLS